MSLALQSQEDMDNFLPYLTTSGLAYLSLSSRDADRRNVLQVWPVWTASVTADFLARSACSLTTLCLKRLPITDRQAIILLELMPDLTSLQIEELEDPGVTSNRVVTDTFLQQLVVDQESYRLGQAGDSFLPRLTDIRLRLHGNNLSEQDLFAVVSSRWIPEVARQAETGIACLTSVDITVMGGDSKLESLQCYRDAGLRLNVTYQPIVG
ncbi:hypothetical protein V5O48_013615 [Marasmius crinis-equi]|uniref:Uncharacterized protein n=1 Tax=Marasmius crinis-equi TaxID=585013 RepID=A0ABR3EZL5_9AGAR